ncbi:MAG: cell division protein ZapA [Aquabacterium sp.]|jgi:cell division protein ZapA|uniref:cell division protein ZapA n=1 Tax=Aquabacterium sp. TaxID=1872578 RepID=UPI002A36D91C|nr:cell division protein ZapA [Aquabacterium sp.]MDX9844036.1 cell division protein ZapA [Aquabacterium sp.]
MKQIEVSIMGQSYLLGCPEGGEERLREAVSQVDREMCAIRDSGKLKARERIAVLAALNLAYILADRPAASAAVSAPANATASGNADAGLPAPEYLDQLIQRLDQALDSDGHLI